MVVSEFNCTIPGLEPIADKLQVKMICLDDVAKKNGLGMSLYQGAAQIELWTGEKAPVEAMRKELMDILAESK